MYIVEKTEGAEGAEGATKEKILCAGMAAILEEAGRLIVINDRLIYAPVYDTIEKYSAAGGLMLSGDLVLATLTGAALNHSNFGLDLYTSTFDKTSKELADAVYKTKAPMLDLDMTVVKINVPGQVAELYIGSRLIVKIIAIEKHRGQNIFSLYRPIVVKSAVTANDIKALPYEHILLGMTHDAYLLNREVDWTLLNEIMTRFVAAKKSRVFKRRGGHDDGSRVAGAEGSETAKTPKTAEAANLSEALELAAAVSDDVGAIHLNGPAFEYYGLKSSAVDKRVAVIYSEPDGLADLLTPKLGEISVTTYPTHISSDAHLMKSVLSCVIDGKKTAVMDVYNSTTYEVVPYVESEAGDGAPSQRKIGAYYVVLRFALVDAWGAMILSDLAGMESRANNLLNRCAELMILAPGAAPAPGAASAHPAASAPGAAPTHQAVKYAGIFILDQVLAKKRRRGRGRPPHYYPANKDKISE